MTVAEAKAPNPPKETKEKTEKKAEEEPAELVSSGKLS